MRKTCETWETHEKLWGKRVRPYNIVKINYTCFAIHYFLVQLNFLSYSRRKSLCLVHNYRFYHETVRDARHKICLVKQQKKIWNNMYTRVASRMFFTSHRRAARWEKHARCETCVLVILYFLCCFMGQNSRVSNCLTVEVVIMHETKGFSHAIRDKIIVRGNNRILNIFR